MSMLETTELYTQHSGFHVTDDITKIFKRFIPTIIYELDLPEHKDGIRHNSYQRHIVELQGTIASNAELSFICSQAA